HSEITMNCQFASKHDHHLPGNELGQQDMKTEMKLEVDDEVGSIDTDSLTFPAVSPLTSEEIILEDIKMEIKSEIDGEIGNDCGTFPCIEPLTSEETHLEEIKLEVDDEIGSAATECGMFPAVNPLASHETQLEDTLHDVKKETDNVDVKHETYITYNLVPVVKGVLKVEQSKENLMTLLEKPQVNTITSVPHVHNIISAKNTSNQHPGIEDKDVDI
ncbi:hypothetical protein L9F63_009248, partial [Diploptera punctata]